MGKGGFSKGTKGKGKEETDLTAIAAAAAAAAVQEHLWWQEDTWWSNDAIGEDDHATPAAGSNAWAGSSTEFQPASMQPIYKHLRYRVCASHVEVVCVAVGLAFLLHESL